MAITIGIDSGGTYTDAVAYSQDEKKILGSAKALTTRDNLLTGILGALDGLPRELLTAAAGVSLSTTLATNACVEEKGGLGRLVLINVSEKILDWVGKSYGLPPRDEICVLQCGDENREGSVAAGWKRYIAENPDWLRGAEGIAVVQLDALTESAALERALREHICREHSLPVMCGHELFTELNSLKRAASTLLNVRLIPVIGAFLKSVERALKQRGVNAPVTVVRSDGSLMSETFTEVRPVETLLCGPAAGVIGGCALASRPDSLIIDMGGTTTDVSIVREGRPVKAEDGINIGRWKTFVRGVFVDTFGLGGDSAVRLDKNRTLALHSRRAVPLCMAAARWPEIGKKLDGLVKTVKTGHTMPLQEFFILQKMPEGIPLTRGESALCDALQAGPLSYSEAAAACGADIYTLDAERLESMGVVARCGVTPTDAMHIMGDFVGFDSEAAMLGVSFIAAGLGRDAMRVCGEIYDMVKKKLYVNIVRILLCDRHPRMLADGLTPELETLAEKSWESACAPPKVDFLRPLFRTQATLVGIGAPTHIFLPDVARALGTDWVVPEQAAVANALGAAVSKVEAVAQVDIKPDSALPGEEGYVIYGVDGSSYFRDRDEAVANASAIARELAREEALRRGAKGDIDVEVEVRHNEAQSADMTEIYLGSKVVATAVGGMLG